MNWGGASMSAPRNSGVANARVWSTRSHAVHRRRRDKSTSTSGREKSAKWTNDASRGGASGSERRRNRPQDVPENAILQLECLRAVILVVSRCYHDNEIELRDDADRLSAST